MSKTKFMVIRLKELIKTAVFAIIGAAIIIALIILIVPNNSNKKYKSGTYTTNITLGNETASVSLTFDKDTITDVSFIPITSTMAVFYPTVQTTADDICAQILSTQSTSSINVNSEYTLAGELIIAAADACIERATID